MFPLCLLSELLVMPHSRSWSSETILPCVMALEDYSEYRHAVRIWQIMSPMLMLFGTAGNLLTLIVLSKRRSRNNSTALYLCALAISDMVVLNTGLLRQWMLYVFEFDIRALPVHVCKLHVFLVYLSTQCSSWFLVAMTCERFVGVWLPHKVKHGCTRKAALIVITVIVACLILLNSHWFYGLEHLTFTYANETYEYTCTTKFYPHTYDMFSVYTWPWIDLYVFCIVPFVILLIGNLSIILRLLLSRRKTRKRVMQIQLTKVATQKDDKTSQLTAMLVLLNVVFFINISPVSTFLVSEPFWKDSIITEHDDALYSLVWSIVNMFMYLNNAVNFMLYFLSGSRFRAEVKVLFCGGQGMSVFGVGTTARHGAITTKQTMQTTPGNTSSDCKNGNTPVQSISLTVSKSKDTAV